MKPEVSNKTTTGVTYWAETEDTPLNKSCERKKFLKIVKMQTNQPNKKPNIPRPVI